MPATIASRVERSTEPPEAAELRSDHVRRRLAHGTDATRQLADEREESRNLGGERLRLLERGEVPAAPGLAPVADVGEARGGLVAGRALQFVRENRAAGRRVDAVAR